jgi:hypothetical protein
MSTKGAFCTQAKFSPSWNAPVEVPPSPIHRPAEAAALGVAVGAAEVALLGDRQRQRAQGRIAQRRGSVDEPAGIEAFGGQEVGERARPGDRRRLDPLMQPLGKGEDPRAIGEQDVRPVVGLEQMQVGEARPARERRGGRHQLDQKGMPMPLAASASPSSSRRFISSRAAVMCGLERSCAPCASSA